jgi:hypothetical protein
MSWKATAYVKPLKAAPGGTPLSRGEKFLLFILADYHNDEQRAAWPSAAALARDALMTLRHVRNLISSLKSKGVICTSQRHSAEGDFDTNLYHFHALDCSDDHEGGSEMISLPPLGGPKSSEAQFTTGSEVEFTTVVKPISLPVVKKQAPPYKDEPPVGASTEPQPEPTHTHALPLLALAEGAGGGVCAKSKFTFEQRLSYARNRPGIQNPEGFAASRRASEGEFDEAISVWLAELERPGSAKRLDVSGCPDCFGTGMWYPEGPGRGVTKCGHEKLLEQQADAAPVTVPP